MISKDISNNVLMYHKADRLSARGSSYNVEATHAYQTPLPGSPNGYVSPLTSKTRNSKSRTMGSGSVYEAMSREESRGREEEEKIEKLVIQTKQVLEPKDVKVNVVKLQ